MNHWTWVDWLGACLWAGDIGIWLAIIHMHMRERWEEQREQARLARKIKLDKEKEKALRFRSTPAVTLHALAKKP